MFQGERIVLRRLLTRKFRLQASMTAETMITTDNVLNMIPRNPDASVAFALGLLNSRLMSWFYVNTSMIAQKDDFPQVHISALAALSIPRCDKAKHDRMVVLVDRMLELHQQKQIAQERSTTRARQEREIHVDRRSQIACWFIELYGLTVRLTPRSLRAQHERLAWKKRFWFCLARGASRQAVIESPYSFSATTR